MAQWIDFYNNGRLHGALLYLTPADYFEGRKESRLAERREKLHTADINRKALAATAAGLIHLISFPKKVQVLFGQDKYEWSGGGKIEMKIGLMLQSLSPLALLTIIQNFSFVTENSEKENLTMLMFIKENMPLLVVIVICAFWVIFSVYFYIRFKAFSYTGTKGGYDISVCKEDNEASLNFFLTLIVPLVIDNVSTWQGATVFFIILFLICVLLLKTKLFYANPILSILGYHVYEFKFISNKNEKAVCIGIGKMKENDTIKFKKISDNVYYVRGK